MEKENKTTGEEVVNGLDGADSPVDAEEVADAADAEEVAEVEEVEEVEEVAADAQQDGVSDGKKKSLKQKLKDLDKANNTKWQALKYFFCMCSAGIIQLVSSAILEAVLKATLPDWGNMFFIIETPKSTFTATTVGLALSILWNFTLNRKFTFKSAKNVPVAMALAFLFYVPFYPFQTWFVPTVQFGLSPSGASWAFIIATGLVMILNGVLEFCWQRFVIYRKSVNSAVKNDGADAKADDAKADDAKENDVKAESKSTDDDVTEAADHMDAVSQAIADGTLKSDSDEIKLEK